MVGMAEVHVTRDPTDVLMALGLGSCIGVCLYDAERKIAGMVHVVLPDSGAMGDTTHPGKYADTGVPALIAEMRRAGAKAANLAAAIAGGAQLFSFAGSGPRLDIGGRNAEAVLAALRREGLAPVARDVGGTCGRTVQFYAADGRINVKSIGRGQAELAVLGAPSRALELQAA
jgi:chemotaxis protein CheD